jgi:hypothetical protein
MTPVKGPVTGSTVLSINYGTIGLSDGCLDILDRGLGMNLLS